MTCTACGSTVPDKRFCVVCGAPAATTGSDQGLASDLAGPDHLPAAEGRSPSGHDGAPEAAIDAAIDMESDRSSLGAEEPDVHHVESASVRGRRMWPMVLASFAVVVIVGGGFGAFVITSNTNRVAGEFLTQLDDVMEEPGIGAEVPSDDETEAAAPDPEPTVQTVSASSQDHSWIYSNDFGYEVQGILSVGELTAIDGEVTDVEQRGLRASAGQVCDLVAGRDAIVPVQATLTNSSRELPVGMAMTIGFGGDSQVGAPTVEVAQVFATDEACESGPYDWNGGGWGVQWAEPVEPNDSSVSRAFLVLKDYFTPQNPGGHVQWLRTLEAGVFPATNEDTSDSFNVQGEATFPIGRRLAAATPRAAASPAPTENMYQVTAKGFLSVRDSASVEGAEIGRVDGGEKVHIVCVAEGDSVEDKWGRSISNWDRIDYPMEGYVSDAFVDTGGKRAPVPGC